ncbi:MAG TPA: hypothetical protein VFE54_14790 [Mucilaginibacter sp.]|jgi:hypothetical protein|nr:hypothetical protein [Mucilaginibacter sp.]
MKYSLAAFLLIVLISCKDKTVHKASTKQKAWHPFSLRKNSIIDAKFPLKLGDINLQDTTNTIEPTPYITQKIEKIIYDNYLDFELGDSSQTYHTVKETYVKTIRLRESLYTMYMVLTERMNNPDGEILFYDNKANKFIDQPIDFNLFGLYNEDKGRLYPSNLKTLFKITSPEIELIKDKKGIAEYKFNRLYHNGTANAIETTILKVVNNKIDTVLFKQKWIGATQHPYK